MAVLSGTLTGHPAKREQPSFVLIQRLGNDLIELMPIMCGTKQILAVIPPQDHVVATAGNM
jgi:hypothetical protein